MPTGVGKKLAETMPVTQCSLPGQVAGSDLLGVHKQETMVDFYNHIERCFQAMQCSAWQNRL